MNESGEQTNSDASSGASHRFALSEAVEALTEKGYVVLGPETAESAAVVLGAAAWDTEIDDATSLLAVQVLAAFPEGFGSSKEEVCRDGK